ncbi:hypothetical protein [uncultured Desulfobacter sp.]|uniref:hypothetical protein n=1 Tax=uncultured Desulfobacter sp. TaxID=240139 RepID=UPI0029F5C69B|nr:hypothetical protein [uncultured Desulfobacter sp.]
MKKNIVVFGIIVFFYCSWVQAQEIKLHFPYFSGQQYDWKIFQGEKEVTIKSGEIFKGGQVILAMPNRYQNYRGMTRWLLKKAVVWI